MSVSITLEDDIDISRGDMIVRSNNKPEASQDIEVMLCWLNNNQQSQGQNTQLSILPMSKRP